MQGWESMVRGALAVLLATVWPAVGSLVVGEAIWDPGLRDWRAPLELEVAVVATPAATNAPRPLADATSDVAPDATAPSITPDITGEPTRLADIPGFHEDLSLFLLELGARDWVGVPTAEGTNVSPFAADDLPDGNDLLPRR